MQVVMLVPPRANIHVARAWFLFALLSIALVPATPGRSSGQTKLQAEAQLRQMSPEEIEAKIKELGLTKDEAIIKAAQLGISLDQFLGASRKLQPPPEATVSAPTPAIAPATAAKVEQPPQAALPQTTDGLPYFGYDIFSNVPAAFEPTAVGPVDPQYVVGPDDVLRITMWGQVESQNEVTVDKEGRIFLPTIGQVLVSGLTLEQTYAKLLKQLSRSYSGLIARNPTVWLDVTLARLRPKRVFIMGEVPKPGGYTVSSYATVFNSLYSVGGPTTRGSLREVRVVRGDKVIGKIDLYDYLLGADQTNDIRVQNNDIIFVPVRGKTVSIRGGVRRPAIYELKENENLSALLRFSGGVLSTAYAGQAQIDRVKPFEKRTADIRDRIVVDVDLKTVLGATGRDVPLYDADEVQVFSILDEKENYVSIQGSVWRPGRYQLGQIQTLRDLIAAAEGIQPKTYMELAHLVRFNEDLITKRIIPLDLGKVLSEPDQNRRLMPRDELIIYSTEVTEVKEKFVVIRGEVKKPGQVPFRNNMTLEDLIALAGGYTESAELLEAEVSRIMPGGLRGDSLVVLLHPKLPLKLSAAGRGESLDTADLGSLVAQGRFPLQHRDEVLIRPNPLYRIQRNITLEGDITYPGVYAIEKRGERISELLARAGGPTKTSYLGGAEYYRGGLRVLVDLGRAYLDKDPAHDVFLQAGDRIIVPSRPHTVLVVGQVNSPGLLSYINGDAVSDYIDRAGGTTDSSSYAVFSKPTGESNRVNFGFLRSNPGVPDGSTINVLKVPPPSLAEKGEPLSTTIKDIFAIATAAATLAFIVWQTTR